MRGLGVALLLIGLAPAVAVAQERAASERCFDEPDHAAAERACGQALDSNTLAPLGQMRALMARASARLSQGKNDAALADYRQAIDLKLGEVAPYRARGLALQDLRRHDAAIADFDQALKIAATDYESLVSRGISRLALGKTDDALEDFSRAIEVEPDDAFAYQWRGDAALAKEKYADAAMDYDSLLRLSPGDPAVALRAGQVRFILGDFERGAEIVAAALRRAPDNADLATWHYAALVRAGKDGRVALEASYAAFQAGGWRQAVADMVLERRTFADALRAAEADQRSAKARLEEVHFVRAIQRLAAGAPGEAVEQFRAVGNLGLTGSSYYRAAKAELGRLAR